MYKGVYVRILAVILTIIMLISLSGCGKGNYLFDFCESGEIYICKISEEVEFWFSNEYQYGEFVKGDEKILFSLKCIGMSVFVEKLELNFYDAFGNLQATLHVTVDISREHLADDKVLLDRAYSLEVMDESQREWFEDFLADIPFKGAYVYKIKQDVPSDTVSIFHIVDSFYEEAKRADAVIVSEEGNFWFEASTGYGEMTLSNGKKQEIYVNIDTMSQYRHLAITQNKDETHYDLEEDAKTKFYRLIFDEEGVHFYLPREGEEKVKSTLKIATEDPRQEYRDFMSPMDDEGNNYTFMCEEGNFTFAGESGFGVWHDGTTDVDIQCTVGEKPFDFYISRIDGTEKTILVKAKLKAIVNENTVMFEIYQQYIINDIFPHMPDIPRYFYIIKQPETP